MDYIGIRYNLTFVFFKVPCHANLGTVRKWPLWHDLWSQSFMYLIVDFGYRWIGWHISSVITSAINNIS